jgi:hypothetical protein
MDPYDQMVDEMLEYFCLEVLAEAVMNVITAEDIDLLRQHYSPEQD